MQYKKSLKILGRAMVSLVLTFVFFRTNFDEKYNACVIAIVFILYEVGISYLCKRRELIKKRGLVTAAICGIVLSITTLIGSFVENEQMFTIGVKSVLFLVAHTIFLGILSLCLFIKLEEVNCRSRNKEFEEIFLNKYGGGKKRVWCILTLCWLPYCIMHFPARLGGGSSNQIMQFYGQETLARNMSSIIYENHYVTNHHPVLLTYFYGIFFEIGSILGDTNAAVFLLSCIILLISSFCMAYLLITVKRYVSVKLYIILLVIVCIYPIFGIYSYTIFKDNLFASVLAIFYALILELNFENKRMYSDRWFKIKLIGVSVLIPFLKNQGLLLVIITLLFIGAYYKNMRRYLGLVACVVILVYVVLFRSILMPALKIAPEGKQEALSIPFQQTALYVRKYKDELSQKEYEIINAVLPADEIAELYVPDRADAVKFRYKQEATGEELLNYFLLWFRQFFKHPDIYFQALFAITDGYYYIGSERAILSLDTGLRIAGASTPEWVLNFQEKEQNFWAFLVHIPVIGYFFCNAIFTWITIFTFFYCIYLRKNKWLLILVPVFLNLLVCMLSPWNGVLRYMLPVIFSFPLQVCIWGKSVVECDGCSM